jgi:hypothetical protein
VTLAGAQKRAAPRARRQFAAERPVGGPDAAECFCALSVAHEWLCIFSGGPDAARWSPRQIVAVCRVYVAHGLVVGCYLRPQLIDRKLSALVVVVVDLKVPFEY